MSNIKIELRQEDVAKIKKIVPLQNGAQVLIRFKCQEHLVILLQKVQEVVSMELERFLWKFTVLSHSTHFSNDSEGASDQHLHGYGMLCAGG